jgi:hypothetical protein
MTLVLALSAMAFLKKKPYDILHCQFGWFGPRVLAERAVPAGSECAGEQARDGGLASAAVDADPQRQPLLAEAVAVRDGTLFREGAGSVAACPLRTETGQVQGALVVASLDPERPLSRDGVRAVEVVADLAAMALERAALLEDEGRRVRDGVLLERAVESVSEAIELDEVYRRVAEHAAEVTGARQAVLTRLNARSGALRTAASVDLTDGPPALLELDSDSFGYIARTRRPLLDASGSPSLMLAPIEIGPDDWPWWRGPTGNNQASGPSPPVTWSDSENLLWQAKIPGEGHSTPIVVGDKVFLTYADAAKQRKALLALDRESGQILWDTEIHKGGFMKAHSKNSQASSTVMSRTSAIERPL